MLKIVGNDSFVILQDNEKKEDNFTCTPLVPKVKNYNKLSFDHWYEKYNFEIEQLWNRYEYLLTTIPIPLKYIHHYNMTNMKKDFLNLLYKSSYNSYKNFI